MSPERWQEIERLYNSALTIESGRRESFVKEACAGDESLRREVEQLLASQPRIERFIESSALEVTARILAKTRPTSNATNLVGRTLTHYHVIEKIGGGGMGDVYRARDDRLGRDVAVKVLPAEFVTDPKRKQRFIREAKAASALNHPNIITVHEIAHDHDLDFIVMEYVAGKTLDQSIGPKGLRLPVALNYATQIAEALAAAHAAGIVHRDLKPGNVMITASGLVKLLDFGLAKLTESARGSLVPSESQHPDSEEGRIFGTVAYMSPEQAEGKAVDARSDIFSFGSLLYEMLTGQRAFQGESKLSTLSAILHREPKPVCDIIVSVPPELEDLVRRCLRKDPARRFQHIDDVKVALLDITEESDAGAVRPVPVRAEASYPADGVDCGHRDRCVCSHGVGAAAIASPRGSPTTARRAARSAGGPALASNLLTRRRAGGVRVERREARQLGYLRHAGRVVRHSPTDDRSRRRWQSDVVARRPADRVPARATRRYDHSACVTTGRCRSKTGRLPRRRFDRLVFG